MDDGSLVGDGPRTDADGTPLPHCPSERLRWEVTVIGRDSRSGREPSRIALASALERVVAAFVDDVDGSARPRAVRASWNDWLPERVDLDAVPRDAVALDLLRVEGGWLVAYERGEGGIGVRALDENLGSRAEPATLAERGGRPRLVARPTGAWVLWQDGTHVHGVAVSAHGAPIGSAIRLAELVSSDARFDATRFAEPDAMFLAWAGTPAARRRLAGRRIEDDGRAAAPVDVGASGEAVGAVSIGGRSHAPAGGSPALQGAVAFDVSIDTMRAVRFVVVGVDARPALSEITVSEADGSLLEHGWGASIATFGTGYAIAYRARPFDGDRARTRLAWLDRDGCELGRVSGRSTVWVSDVEASGPTSLVAAGGTLVVGWTEQLDGVQEMRLARGRCEP
ncbi:MAG: hypothetical protein NZ898_05880 [Myxococcota bacterium]|nr:hypothetical protein [Myxococcota bacterium]MDW8361458.1 hypothetical protein [Myxococcales bacterium]